MYRNFKVDEILRPQQGPKELNLKMTKKITFYILILIILSLSLTGCFESETKTGQNKRTYFVYRIIDGDTIELSNAKLVRYIGIDTPEVRKKIAGTWQYDPEPYALQANDCNKDLVEGKKVILEFDVEKEDKYNRWLAYVYVDEKMVNEEILKQGYAKLLSIPPNTKYYVRLKTAQTQANEAKRGIWK